MDREVPCPLMSRSAGSAPARRLMAIRSASLNSPVVSPEAAIGGPRAARHAVREVRVHPEGVDDLAVDGEQEARIAHVVRVLAVVAPVRLGVVRRGEPAVRDRLLEAMGDCSPSGAVFRTVTGT